GYADASSFPDSLNRNALRDSVNRNVMPAEESGQSVKRSLPTGGTSQQDTTISLNLKEIVLSASFVNERRTPLRLKSVGKGEIEGKAIGKTYPELVRDIPGVYATSESGSYGDAKINIRGFKQENISVMLNGIPISGLVTGNMFWNNWLGLADATHSIQVQKGIGASMLSDNSVGGTINIITTTPQQNSSVSAGMFYTGYGLGKAFVNMHSGLLKGGWAFSLMASYAGGSGYVDGSGVNSWAYLMNINKKINNHHSLLFTILGSPERHEQRSARLSNAEVEQYGLRYNKNWGYRTNPQTGEKEPFNLSENFYHKPYFTLHHFYTPGNNTEIANTAYLSIGNGGGRWSESKGKRIIDFQKDGQIEWDAVTSANQSIPGTIENEAGSSKNILSDYLAGHTQAGIKSNISHKLTDKFTLTEGIHYQFYSTWEKEKITDMLGGNYWYEDYSKSSLAGLAGRNPVKHVGDYIYTSDIFSPSASALGYSVKGGALYRITPQSSVYLNAAAYSRLPYSDVFFSSGNNEITNDVKNERNLLSELGYRFLFQRGSIEATAYVAYWKNKTIMSDPYKQLDNSANRYMIQGLDALHSGLEIDAEYRPTGWLNLKGYASFANWNWKNDVSAKIYDNYSGLEIGSVNVYSDGLVVGDAPQTQVALFADVKLYKELRFSADWRYNARLFADFDPVSRQNSQDRASSLQLPNYQLINMSLSWRENWGKWSSTIFINVNNALNTKYIERGKDGANHTLQSFRGFWGFGTNANIGVRIDMKSFGF
ncbi:MAG: cirA, partial [Bacteroidetes bacterium]|nr:cirA [Bacteroidota bacterium]